MNITFTHTETLETYQANKELLLSAQFVDLQDLVEDTIEEGRFGTYQIKLDGQNYGELTIQCFEDDMWDTEWDSLAGELDAVLTKGYVEDINLSDVSELFKIFEYDLSVIANEGYSLYEVDDYLISFYLNELDHTNKYIKPIIQFIEMNTDNFIFNFLELTRVSDNRVLLIH